MTMKIAVVGTGGVAERNYLPYITERDDIRLSYLNRTRSKAAVGKLFTELGPRYQERPGGYMRILKCGYRAGDAAPMAFVELVDRPRPEPEDDYDDEADE